jgi:hypothetical protein
MFPRASQLTSSDANIYHTPPTLRSSTSEEKKKQLMRHSADVSIVRVFLIQGKRGNNGSIKSRRGERLYIRRLSVS